MTTATTIKIGTLNCTPKLDPWHLSTGKATSTLFILDDDGEFRAEQDCDDGSTPAPIWNGLWVAGAPQSWPREDALRRYIENMGGHELLEIVHAEHKFDYNDSGNKVGWLTEVGEETWNKFLHEVDTYLADYVYNPCFVYDLLSDWTPEENESAEEAIRGIEVYAEQVGYLIIGDLEAAVKTRFA